MEEKKEILELLPQGQFIITKKDGQKIKGRFSMYVLDRFCETKGIDNYLKLLEAIMTGLKLSDYAELILFAFQDYYRSNLDLCEYKNKNDVMDFIDEHLDGMSSDEIDTLVRHAVGRMTNIKKVEEAVKKQITDAEEAEKKSELKSSSTETGFNNEPTKQV
jgi:hypothetical protein